MAFRLLDLSIQAISGLISDTASSDNLKNLASSSLDCGDASTQQHINTYAMNSPLLLVSLLGGMFAYQVMKLSPGAQLTSSTIFKSIASDFEYMTCSL